MKAQTCWEHVKTADQYWKDACATDHRAAGARERRNRRGEDKETQGSSTTQWWWRSYREQRPRRDKYHTVVSETSTGHAVAESQSPADQNEKAHCCKVPDREGTRASTANQRPRSSAVPRGGLEVPEEAFAEWQTTTM